LSVGQVACKFSVGNFFYNKPFGGYSKYDLSSSINHEQQHINAHTFFPLSGRMESNRSICYPSGSRPRGLAFFIWHFNKPKLDVTPITNSIEKNNQIVGKEIYLAVRNKGKTAAERCRVSLTLPPLFESSPNFKPPPMFQMVLQHARQFYLDWFEPSTIEGGLSAIPLPPESASKECDIFPDPDRVLFAGTIRMDGNTVTIVQLTDTIRGQHAQISQELEWLRGKIVDVTVKFRWERGQVESVCKKYRLDMRSFETFGLKQIS
jgi:hypothetical protein